MVSSLIGRVVRNPVYVLLSMIFVILNVMVSDMLFTQDFSARLVAMAISMIIVSLFMSGNGAVLKQISRSNTVRINDFLQGVKTYFLRLLGINFLSAVSVLFVGPVVFLILKPTILMGGIPQTLVREIISILVSPLVVLWYPVMVIDNIGILDSLKKAFAIGKKIYRQLVVCIFISLLPFFAYIGFMSLTGSESTMVYYTTYAIAFVIGVFSTLYLFDLYHTEISGAHNII